MWCMEWFGIHMSDEASQFDPMVFNRFKHFQLSTYFTACQIHGYFTRYSCHHGSEARRPPRHLVKKWICSSCDTRAMHDAKKARMTRMTRMRMFAMNKLMCARCDNVYSCIWPMIITTMIVTYMIHDSSTLVISSAMM